MAVVLATVYGEGSDNEDLMAIHRRPVRVVPIRLRRADPVKPSEAYHGDPRRAAPETLLTAADRAEIERPRAKLRAAREAAR